MKTLLTILAAAAALVATPALAQDHAAHHQHPEGAAKPADVGSTPPAKMHEHCAAPIAGAAQGTPQHAHPAGKSHGEHTMKGSHDAEMKAMHDKCAAARHKAHAPPAAK